MPSSIGSYAQAAELSPPPRREQEQSVADKAKEEQSKKQIRSEAGEGRGGNLDINA